MAVQYALSLKQPWAALLVAGRKVIEVRRWPTARRGHILIHAARVSDPRPEVWKLVPPELEQEAHQVGGIIGAGELMECRIYRDRATFAADQAKHWNDPDWFQGPALYGFVFAKLHALPFQRYPGWMRFFPVDEERLPQRAKPAPKTNIHPSMF
jgi:hypothetical protein